VGTSVALLVGVLVGLAAGLIAGVWITKRLAKSVPNTDAETQRQLREQSEKMLTDRLRAAEADRANLRADYTELTGKLRASEAREAAALDKYEKMNADLNKAFGDLAAKALRDNHHAFLELAKHEFGAETKKAEGTLEAKELAIRQMLKPIEESLKTLDEKTQAMEVVRAGAYGGLESLVREIKTTLPVSLEGLKRETAQLIHALRAPKVRGNWGELQLRRCVEYAGMLNYCSFREQVSSRNEEEQLIQPDMVIQLPNGRRIVVDAKTPLDAFLDSGVELDATSQTHRFAAHALRVKTHLKELSAKAYWRQFEPAPEFVVCFLPSEALFSAALEAEPSLIEFIPDARVIMATPTTLIALLKAVAYGWQQSEITQSAKAIQEAGKSLYGKIANAHEHFLRMGNSLAHTVANYNRLVGSVEGRDGVFFRARKLGDLVHSDEELEQLQILPAEKRVLAADDWVRDSGISLAAEGEDS
jgi:DNA recombination protein RmuC